MSTIQQEVECESQHKSDLHNEVKNVNGATLHENESALSIYKDLVDTLIAPEHASEIQMYEVIKHDICGLRAEHQLVVEDIVYAL